MYKKLQDEFWNAFADSPFIMMRLRDSDEHSEPMTAHLDREAHHEIWFFTAQSNRIAKGGKAIGEVITKGNNVFASIKGTLVEEADKAVWDKHWTTNVEAWFPNGRNDPQVKMLRFEIEDAEVWTAHASESGKVKLMTGEPIAPEEAGEHATGPV